MKAAASSAWEVVPLGTLADFRNGVNYTKKSFGRGIKIINVKNFKDYSIASYGDLDEIDPDGVVRSDDVLRDNDIIFVRSNGNRELIGRSMFISAPRERVTHSAFTIRARFTSDRVMPRFYAYLFRAPLIRQTLSAKGGGTNISNLNQGILSSLEVPLPPFSVQESIVEILSAYDDSIRNNTRRIEILEEMAHTIYREWFVRFRFPGHEKVEMVESSAGRIPSGWDAGQLSDALVLQRGFDLPSTQRGAGAVPVYAATGVVGTHDESKVRGPGVVTGRSGSLGTVIYIDEDFWPLNTTLWVKEFRRATPAYAFYLLRGLALGSFNSGAAVPTLNRNDIHGLPIVIPPKRVLERFDQHIAALFSMKKNLVERNTRLERARDLLLPKLVAGEMEIDVTADSL